jgi:hypothetical protein
LINDSRLSFGLYHRVEGILAAKNLSLLSAARVVRVYGWIIVSRERGAKVY